VQLYADSVTREFTVRLALDTSFIDKWTAAAWGVNNTIPVIVEILFTWQVRSHLISTAISLASYDICG
jgi:hypothetical protein